MKKFLCAEATGASLGYFTRARQALRANWKQKRSVALSRARVFAPLGGETRLTLVAKLCDRVSEQWDQALARLESFLESRNQDFGQASE